MMRRSLDGVLLLDKPAGVGSNAVLQAVKRLYGAAKAGHAGTLDPLASGLLVVLFGEATKFAQLALDADKEYMARACLGVTTDTADAEGRVLERRPCTVREADIEPTLARFRGEIEQIPPMYSALKRAGRPLYELARAGHEVPRAARRIRVQELQHLGFRDDSLELRVRCSKGTYVRTLVEDIGRALGCGAHLAALRRTRSGGLRIEDATTLDALQRDTPAGRDSRLLPVERLLTGLPRVDLPAVLAERFARGQVLHMEQAPAGQCSVYGQQGRLLGLGEGRAAGELRPRRLVSHASG
ncbi:MAG: tRNA pseudouridine(55) synthase TruB [Burkholderiales bacterium]